MNDLSEYVNQLDEKEPRWFAVYTPYKREKYALRQLQSKQITVYLPIQRLVRQYTRKRKIVELPLISCYIFVKITKAEYVRVLETEQVLNFVRFSKNLLAIPDAEIQLLKRILGEGIEVNVEKTTYSEGDWVEIISGNLTGLKGRLIQIQDKKHFTIDLEHLGYSLRMTVHPDALRKLHRPVAMH